MGIIFLALTVFLLLVNLAGVALCSHRWLGHYPVAKVVGILSFCLLFFSIEHFIGLGNLHWLWPLSTAVSGYMIYRSRQLYMNGLWKDELVVVLGFVYGLLWRVAFPDITGGAEALTDLSFVSNYYTGMTLPPEDTWLPGYSFNFYYAFQHYGAALLGRIFGLQVGYSFNLAFALLMALLISLSWSIAGSFCTRWVPKLILVIAVIAGGTGVSPLVPFFYDHPAANRSAQAFASTNRLWASIRFVGIYEGSVTTDFARHILFPNGQNYDRESLDLPLETIGYTTFLGIYHPPMGGALILMVALSCLLLLEQKHPLPHERALQASLVATGPFMLLTNTWVLPLQAALVFAWMAYRLLTRRTLCYSAVLLGGLVPLLLAYPFLSEFGAQALHTPIHLVEAGQHTPLSRWLLMLWPQLLLILTAACVARTQPVAWFLLGITALLLGVSELVFVDDPLGGKFSRFNTSLKWWPWLQVAILLGLGAVLLGAQQRWIRWLTLTTLVLVGSYSVEMAYYWSKADKPSFAKLHGHHWLTKEPVNAQMLAYLQVAPRGVVLEGLYGDSYIPTSALALFANKPSLTGWPAHEYQWRGNPPFIHQVGNEAKQFYQGTLSNSLQWLAKHEVAYIVWREVEQEKYPAAWRKIHQQITREYFWLPFKQHDDVRVGIWQRKRGDQG